MNTTRTILLATLFAVSGLAAAQDVRPANTGTALPQSAGQTISKPTPMQTVLQGSAAEFKAVGQARDTANASGALPSTPRTRNNGDRLNALFFTNP